MFHRLEYHTFLHHSQTFIHTLKELFVAWVPYVFTSFSNGFSTAKVRFIAWVPYVFTSFSNKSCIFATRSFAWVPYVFTSFSNNVSMLGESFKLEYHTFLHHSQTTTQSKINASIAWVPYVFTSFSNVIAFIISDATAWVPYVFTSFSNDAIGIKGRSSLEYHTFLHHSQTEKWTSEKIFSAWVPYVFTSFSNLKFKNEMPSPA